MNEVADQRVAEYQRRICQAMNFISDNLRQDISLEDIAQAAHFSKYHFHRLFHAMTGETVGGFIKRLRLERAAQVLLYDQQIDITRLALDYSFSSPQNFARAFKHQFQVTPSQFRQEKSNRRHTPSSAAHYDSACIQWHNSGVSDIAHSSVVVKSMPAWQVAYTRRRGAYGYANCSKAYDKLIPWALQKHLLGKQQILGVAWDYMSVTSASLCRYDACITVPDNFKVDSGMALQTIAAGTYAEYTAEIVANDFDTPWEQFMAHWLPANGFQPDDKPRYEIALQRSVDEAVGRWRMALYCPVKPL